MAFFISVILKEFTTCLSFWAIAKNLLYNHTVILSRMKWGVRIHKCITYFLFCGFLPSVEMTVLQALSFRRNLWLRNPLCITFVILRSCRRILGEKWISCTRFFISLYFIQNDKWYNIIFSLLFIFSFLSKKSFSCNSPKK